MRKEELNNVIESDFRKKNLKYFDNHTIKEIKLHSQKSNTSFKYFKENIRINARE